MMGFLALWAWRLLGGMVCAVGPGPSRIGEKISRRRLLSVEKREPYLNLIAASILRAGSFPHPTHLNQASIRFPIGERPFASKVEWLKHMRWPAVAQMQSMPGARQKLSARLAGNMAIVRAGKLQIRPRALSKLCCRNAGLLHFTHKAL